MRRANRKSHFSSLISRCSCRLLRINLLRRIRFLDTHKCVCVFTYVCLSASLPACLPLTLYFLSHSVLCRSAMLRICLFIINVCLVISCAGSSLTIPEPPDDGYGGYNVTGFNFLVEKGPRSLSLGKQFNISAENC